MKRALLPVVIAIGALVNAACGQDAAARRERAQAFHLRAQEKTGVLVPMYVYPANIHTNAEYNRLIALKRRFETVPFWVIVNPASGPGNQVDANYTKAIDRLQGAGCVTLGYVSTAYGKETIADVQADIDEWLKLYPRIHGIFFDEMLFEDTEAAEARQVRLNQHARQRGLWPTVANPGAETPERFFAEDAADVIVVHEGNAWPEEARLKGDYFGGYADYPPFTRAVLLHSSPELDVAGLTMARKYVRWVYVTERPFDPQNPEALNPWDRLSSHLEAVCRELDGTAK